MPTDGQILRSYVEVKKLNRTEFAKALDMSYQNLYQLFKSKKFEADTIKNIEKITGDSWDSIQNINIDSIDTNELMEDEVQYKSLSMRAIINLTESNRSIADSNKSISESNASLARSNEELVKMVRSGATADVQQQIQKDADAMRSVILELLFEVGSGKRWKSADEVGAIYRKRLGDAMGLSKQTDIQKSSDRKHIVK